MSSPAPAKSRWARMGGVVRRASTVLATPPRPSTPSVDSDTASLKGSVRSIPINQPSVHLPSKPAASIPSPIPESPVQTNDSRLQTTTIEQSPLAQTTTASEPQTATQEYTPPPLIDSTAVGPGGFMDDPDNLPKPQPISDPSLRQPDSTDGHEPPAPAIEPITTSNLGGFNDSDDLPQPQTVKAPSLERIDSSDSHKPRIVESAAPRGFVDDDVPETKIARAPPSERTESVDSHKPRLVDSSTVGLGGFTDDLDDDMPQPKVIQEPLVQASDTKAEPVLQTTRSPTPTEPPIEPSTPTREHPAEAPAYFDLPVVTESESHPEATEEFKKQLDNVFPYVPITETPQPTKPSVSSTEEPHQLREMPAPVQVPAAAYNASEIPTPEPAAQALVVSGYTLPSLESGQEVWGGVVHPPVEETKRDTNTATSTRSRSPSIRSMPTEDPFADPIAPRITVYHHDQGTSSAMPQPQTSNPYPQRPANPKGGTGVVVMPLPPMDEVIPQRSMYEQSNQTLSNTVTGYHETDERHPLLPQATSSKVTSYLQPSAASHNIVNLSPQSGMPSTSTWPARAIREGPRLREFGWIEYHLPDGTVYYVHPTRRVTADIDLRDERRLDAVNAYFERHRDGASAPAGMELWLIEDWANDRRRPFRPPLRFLVNHSLQMVAYDQSSTNAETSRRAKKAVEDDQIDIEYRYWSFMEAHPAHASLPPNARAEAMDILTWAWTDRLLPAYHPVPAPFAQEECQELTSLLRSFEQSEGGLQTMLHTRVVSRILLRVAIWRQQHFRPHKPLPTLNGHRYAVPRQRRPLRRALFDFVISCLCLGIPYLFFERGRQSRIDEESGVRSTGPMMFLVCAGASLIAAIVLSASVTFLCLPGLDNFARIAGFVAILFASFSMVSTLVALFRWKAEIDNPISHVAGEGLMRLSRRSVVMALPVILLVYAIIAFVTGIVLYSFWGTANDTLSSQQPFNDHIKWTVIGVLGGLGGMLFTSLLLFGR